MSTVCAPVAYFAFNRPQHTARTLAALAANPEAGATDLHIFIDGPRNDAECSAVTEVADLARTATGFRTVAVHASPRNLGLFRSITRGVTEVVAMYGQIIVVEDDVLVSPHFLHYMNEALARYAGDPQVGSIHGYCPPVPELPDFFFLRGADCWGWATWSDRWSLFDPDADGLLRTVVTRGLMSEFAASHGAQSLLQLVRRARGSNQSWAILWHASLFLAGAHTLHPGETFVENIGHDGSGFHSRESAIYGCHPRTSYHGLGPDRPVRQDPDAARAVSDFMDGIPTGVLGFAKRAVLSVYAKACARWQSRVR